MKRFMSPLRAYLQRGPDVQGFRNAVYVLEVHLKYTNVEELSEHYFLPYSPTEIT